MGLKTVVKSLDGISEDTAKLYVKGEGGTYVLDLDDVDSHPMVVGLSRTKTKERDSRKEFEKKFKALQDKTAGIDLDKLKEVDLEKYNKFIAEYDSLKDEQEKRKRKKLKDKESWEKLEQDLEGRHEEVIQKLTDGFDAKFNGLKQQLDETNKNKDKELGSMQGILGKHLKDKEITKALAAAKGNIPVLTPHLSKLVKVVKTENGGYAARVFTPEGTERFNNLGDPMTIKELVSEFQEKPEFQGAGLFEKETKPGGSGSHHNRDDKDEVKNPWKKGDDFNLTEQAKITNDNPELAKKLKGQATGKG